MRPPRCGRVREQKDLASLPSLRFLRSSASLFLIAIVSVATMTLSAAGGDTGSTHDHDDVADSAQAAARCSVLVVSLGIYQLPRGLIALVDEMIQRGHSVQVAVPHKSLRSAKAGFGLSVRVVAVAENIDVDKLVQKFMQQKFIASRGIPSAVADIAIPIAKPMRVGLNELLQGYKPDVIVADVLALAAIDAAKAYNIPLVLNHPGLAITPLDCAAGLPCPGTGYPRTMTPWMRAKSFFRWYSLSLALLPPFTQLNKQRWELGLGTHRGPDEFFRDALILYNSEFKVFDIPRPLPPASVAVGPLVPERYPSLPPKSEAMIRKGPVLLVNIDPAFLTKDELTHLTMTIDKGRFKVWWVVRPRTTFTGPSSFIQGDVSLTPAALQHPNVAAALVPCAAEFVQEVLYFGKPVACVSISADQNDVAQRLRESGAGVIVLQARRDPYSLADSVFRAVDLVLSDRTYRETAAILSKGLRVSGGLREAVRAIEEVAKADVNHLVPRQRIGPWHEELCYDIYSVYWSVTVVVFYVIRYAFLGLLITARTFFGKLAFFTSLLRRIQDAIRNARDHPSIAMYAHRIRSSVVALCPAAKEETPHAHAMADGAAENGYVDSLHACAFDADKNVATTGI